MVASSISSTKTPAPQASPSLRCTGTARAWGAMVSSMISLHLWTNQPLFTLTVYSPGTEMSKGLLSSVKTAVSSVFFIKSEAAT